MDFIKELLKDDKRVFEFSFSREDLKTLFTSLELIYSGMPQADLSLLLTRNRLGLMIEKIKKVLEDSTPTIITK